MKRRVTQQDIAQRVGMTRATVSMALHKHPSIPSSTQERIRKIAEEMGYTPDPMLSALASYRNTLRPASFQGTLAWLVNNVPPFDWTKFTLCQEYYRGAQQKAASYGYNLEVFDLQAAGATPEKLLKTFRFRNINGLLLPPQPGPHWELDFPWEHFSCVTFGFSLVRPRLHTVAPTQFRAMMETMQRLHGLGYQKIGFACSFMTDQRTDHHYLGGYFVEKFLFEHKFDIPPFDEEQDDYRKFQKWFEKYKPDAVVTNNPRILKNIERAGLQVPRDLGVACPTLPSMSSALAGIYEDSFHMGETAVDVLVGMVMRGERGVPAQPHYILIPGIWLQGTTVRNLSRERKRAAVEMKGVSGLK